MVETITNTRFSKMTGISHDKVKRFALDFLGSDPRATQRRGIARRHSLGDAFVVFLGAHLVSHLNYTTKDAVRIIAIVKPWLISRGIFPGSQGNVEGVEAGIVSYDIEIRRDSMGDFDCRAKGYMSERVLASDSYHLVGYPGRNLYVDEYIIIPINCNKSETEKEEAMKTRRFPVSRLWRAFEALTMGEGCPEPDKTSWGDGLPTSMARGESALARRDNCLD